VRALRVQDNLQSSNEGRGVNALASIRSSERWARDGPLWFIVRNPSLQR
jgi:hypothetical protein